MLHYSGLLVTLALMGFLAACDVQDAAALRRTEVLADGLNNPTGLALSSGGTLLIVESGAGRILSVDSEGTVAALVSGFSMGTFFPYEIGPLSILVQADESIIVGEGGEPTGGERVSFFAADGMPSGHAPLLPIAGGNFHSLAIHPATGELYIAAANSNKIFRATIDEDGNFSDPEDFVADTTLAPIERVAPAALAFDADNTLLVGFAGFGTAGIVRLSTETGPDPALIEEIYSTTSMVTAIAVRPSDSVVFFAEFSADNPNLSRVARFTAEGGVEDFLTDVVAPSALLFSADDTLFVAMLGAVPNTDTGSVVSVPPPDSETTQPTETQEPTDTPLEPTVDSQENG